MIRMRSEEFTVGWICAVGIERAVACGILDQHYAKEREPLVDTSRDHNSYSFGCIHGHNVVIAALPQGRYGITAAAVVAKDMQTSFSNLQIRLMVGIAGGAPSKKNDIRLGDVVVSSPISRYGGVIQYDFGKAIQDHDFEITGYLAPPPENLLNAVAHLRAEHQTRGHRIAEIIANMLDKNPRLRTECSRPPPEMDKLYPADYSHSLHKQCDCQNLADSPSQNSEPDRSPMTRKTRTDDGHYPMIHYGLVASANSVMKNAIARDALVERYDYNVLCFEMEAAGLMNIFPSIVIRGICDYSDSHKNKIWQGYAAAAAAAYAKELLSTLSVRQSRSNFNPEESHFKKVSRSNFEDVPLDREDKECLAKLHLTTPALDKERIEKRAGSLFRDCYKWILDHDAYCRWLKGEQMLWIKGDPGKGKTMLLCGIIDELGKLNLTSISYFFCQTTYGKTNNNAIAVLRGLIWMLAVQNPHLIQIIRAEADSSSSSIYTDGNSFFVLCKLLRNILQDVGESVVLIVDALDECEDGRDDLIDFITETSKSYKVSWLISSRNWPSIEERLGDTPKLSLEIEKSVENAVKTYINHKVSQLSEVKGFSTELTTFISDYLVSHAQGTFLWAALVCTNLRNASKREARKLIKELPPTLDALYSRMLGYVSGSKESDVLSSVLAAATHVRRPLKISELCNVVELSEDEQESIHELIQECGSFLTIRDDIVEFVHQSAQEYIKEYLPQAIDAKSVHLGLYKCSLQCLSTILKRNICQSEDTASDAKSIQLSDPNPDRLASIAYSCLYWVEHLEHSGDLASELRKDSYLSVFLYKHYLFWLEAIALLQSIAQAIHAIHLLYNIVKNDFDGLLVDFIYDAHRFIMYFRTMIETYPLQIYDSGLVFCPTNSLIKQAYACLSPKWVSMVAAPVHDWPIHHTTFRINWTELSSSAYSSKGDRIAVGDKRGHIDIYDVTSGSLSTSISRDQLRCILELAFTQGDSKLVFTRESSTSTTMLATCDLGSNKITELCEFPRGGKLSPDAKHIAYIKDNKGKGSVHCYQVDTGHSFSLPSTISLTRGHHKFSVDGSGIVLWWPNGYIEVWEIPSSTKCGTIQCPSRGESPRFENVALSQRNEILAFQSDGDSLMSRTMVYDVKTGQLLWRSSNTECAISPWFLPTEAILCIPDTLHVLLYYARSGTKLDQLREILRKSHSISTFKHQIAIINKYEIKLFNTTSQHRLPRSLIYEERVTDICGDQLIASCNSSVHSIRWTMSRRIDMMDVLWASSPGIYSVGEDAADQQVIETAWLETQKMLEISSLCKQATIRYSCGCIRTYSPDGNRFFYFNRKEQRFSAFDSNTKTMSVATPTTESGDDERVGYYSNVHIVEVFGTKILTWSHANGLQGLDLEDEPEFQDSSDCCFYDVSPSGNLLVGAAHDDRILYGFGDSDSSDSISSHSSYFLTCVVQIWNLDDGTLKSKFVLENEEANILSCLGFLSCETRVVLLFGSSIQVWTVSGTLLVRRDHLDVTTETFCRSLSSQQLLTDCGVIRINKNIRLGTVDDPYITGEWVWHNDRRVLWIPSGFTSGQMRYSAGRLAMSHESGRIAVLKFSFNQMEQG